MTSTRPQDEPPTEARPRLRVVPAREPLPEVSEAEERAALLVLAEVLLEVRDRIRREDQQQ